MEKRLKQIKEKVKEYFDNSWYEKMRDYLQNREFLQLGADISIARKTKTIYPPSDKVFRVFKELSYDEVKVVFIFQDPYPTGACCGHAVCNCETLKTSPSLSVMLKEVDLEYPENFFEIRDRLDLKDLTRWQRQGVLLLNTALTVEAGLPGSMMDMWTGFTSKVIETLNEKDFVAYALFGKFAERYKDMINPEHCTLVYPHPAAEAYKRGAFLGCGCFKAINSNLKKEILW